MRCFLVEDVKTGTLDYDSIELFRDRELVSGLQGRTIRNLRISHWLMLAHLFDGQA